MIFTKRLREPVMRGEITCSVRIWRSPRVRVGGRYPLGAGAIEVTGLTEIDLADVTAELARRSGFDGVVDLLKVAKHGAGERVFLVEFEYRPEGEREAFIRANLPLGVVASVPEIVLHRAHASSGLMRLAERQGPSFGSPYWAYPWAGGLALARYILDRPQIAAQRRVLDMGCGGGIVAIAAAKAGASQVTGVDTDPNAIAALGLNAAANGVTIRTILGDLTTIGPLPDTDLVTVGDLFYERALAERVTGFLDRCLAAGAEVLVGDPGRAFLPAPRLRKLADYPVSDVGDGQDIAARVSSVFAFEAG